MMANWQEFVSTKIPIGNFEISATVLIVILIVILILKGSAMWRASKNNSKGWFWALLILNTAGILPLLYLTVFSKK